MQDKEKLVVQCKDQPFSDTPNVPNRFSVDRLDRRLKRPHDKGTDNAKALQGLIDNPTTQALAVGLDVGEFGHVGLCKNRGG